MIKYVNGRTKTKASCNQNHPHTNKNKICLGCIYRNFILHDLLIYLTLFLVLFMFLYELLNIVGNYIYKGRGENHVEPMLLTYRIKK